MVSNFTVEKFNKHYLRQVIKVNIDGNESVAYGMYPSYDVIRMIPCLCGLALKTQ